MMGEPLDSEMNVFCDDESVLKISTLPESTLKKKHNSIAYHNTHEAQAVNINSFTLCGRRVKQILHKRNDLDKLCPTQLVGTE